MASQEQLGNRGLRSSVLVDPFGHSVGGFRSSATFLAVAAAIGAGDVMAGAREFANIGPLGGGMVRILSTELLVAHDAVISGETSYALHLYTVTPPSALADNATWDLPSGDRASYRGYIDLGTVVDRGSSLFVQTEGINKDVLVPSGGSLWGYLVTVGGFTATAASRIVSLNAIGFG